MTFAGAPGNGDVVIRIGGHGAAPAFLVRAVPGPDQYGCATRAEAARLARSYAEHAGVNLWFAASPNRFTLLARFRAPARPMPQDTRASAGTARPGPTTLS